MKESISFEFSQNDLTSAHSLKMLFLLVMGNAVGMLLSDLFFTPLKSTALYLSPKKLGTSKKPVDILAAKIFSSLAPISFEVAILCIHFVENYLSKYGPNDYTIILYNCRYNNTCFIL
jgi:hypothetical protein